MDAPLHQLLADVCCRQKRPPTAWLRLKLPSGARFYRCALQVNPFAYLHRNNKQTAFQNEADYNAAIVAACQDAGIEVIGVTDHYRVHESAGLVQAARSAGLSAFSGFEAVTKDGVHFLCLFDPDKDNVLERFIGECGVHDAEATSPTGTLDSLELLAHAKKWEATCIAAHVAADQGGLLKKLSGQTRVNVWTSPDLLACALAGKVDQAPEGMRSILENKAGEYHRSRSVAIINASDVNDPEDLKKEGHSCYIKMSAVSVEALRQAFLDPVSRIRLNSDPQPEPHAEFIAISWEGGFLTDAAVHFNENLNVLVGGRGTGKSTIIASLRYALGLEPLGEDARKAHEGVLRYRDTEKVYDARERVSLRGPMTPLLAADGTTVENGLVEQAFDFVRRNAPGTTVMEDARRIERPAYPSEVLRESIVNALIHRDYLLSASDIELAIYSDRLEIISPGRLPNGITPERMRTGCRAARNQLLKDVMRDYGYLEHMGMGVPRKIIKGMQSFNSKEPELIEADENFILRLFAWAYGSLDCNISLISGILDLLG